MTNSFDTSTFPSQDPTPKKTGGSFRKWGGIAVAIVIGLSVIGSCNSAASDTDLPAETVTVTTTMEAETITETQTVTTKVEVTPDEPTEEVSEPTDVDVKAGLGSANDVDTAPARVATQAPAPAPAPAPVPAPVQVPATTYYANCTAVRAAGAAPLYAGSPGYSGKLDRDGDGIACE